MKLLRRWCESAWYPIAGGSLQRILPGLLAPMAWVYRAGLALRPTPSPLRLEGCRVISIGNLTVGGNGKTPLTLALSEALGAIGQRVAVLSRGYGRKSRGLRLVHEPGGQVGGVADCGDEPVLLARRCPAAWVFVGEDRASAAREIARLVGPDVLLLDDGFQSRELGRDTDLVAVHAQRGFGNRALLPSGPLREPLSALARASGVVFTHVAEETLAELRVRHSIPDRLPAARVRFQPAGFRRVPDLGSVAQQPLGARVLALSGIAYPAGFERQLTQSGLQVVQSIGFADHQTLSASNQAWLGRMIRAVGAECVVTTEKDAGRWGDLELPVPLLALRLEAVWLETPGFLEWLECGQRR